MTATYRQAYNEMLGAFSTAWLADPTSQGLRVQYPDRKDFDDPPGEREAWARVSIQHNPIGGQVTLAGPNMGLQRFRRFGILTVQLFTPKGDGLQLGLDLAMIASRAFESVVTTPGNVIFRGVNVVEVQNPSGLWAQTNVIANFEYDEQH